MLHTRTTRRYAKALFNMARDSGRLEEVGGDLADLRALLERSPDLLAFLTDYMIPSEQRLDVLKSLFEDRLNDLTRRFLFLLEEQKRLKLLAPIVDAFNEIADQARGVVKAKVTAARPMTDQQLAAVRQKIELKLKKRVVLEAEINPDLLGGFQVLVGDVLYDSSAAHQLEVFRQRTITA